MIVGLNVCHFWHTSGPNVCQIWGTFIILDVCLSEQHWPYKPQCSFSGQRSRMLANSTNIGVPGSVENSLARNAHRVSSAVRRNFGRNFAQLGRKSVQPSAISTTAQPNSGHDTSAKSLAPRNVSGSFSAKNTRATISASIGPPGTNMLRRCKPLPWLP